MILERFRECVILERFQRLFALRALRSNKLLGEEQNCQGCRAGIRPARWDSLVRFFASRTKSVISLSHRLRRYRNTGASIVKKYCRHEINCEKFFDHKRM